MCKSMRSTTEKHTENTTSSKYNIYMWTHAYHMRARENNSVINITYQVFFIDIR
jgi:hypothetical protein